ncbi:MAG: mta [Bacteroidetes bacterium]|jgi:DNA-binding transcriptional MerR regulator|nr:mta [Bacteroidota bacterium]
MEKFSVNRLAKLAGVSVRTLHHYDEIGLLKPAIRAESKYRYYGKEELLRLQQILLYKEMDFTLAQIAEILDDPDFDLLKALGEHRKQLQRKKQRMAALLQTVDKTIVQLKTKKMNYEEMYKGFGKEKFEAYTKEAKERWGEETINQSHKKILAMDKKDWEALKQRGEDINKALTAAMDLKPEDAGVQELIRQHYEMMGCHFDVTKEIYRGLGSMYVEDERFTAYYEKYRPGLAAFLRDAIHLFCANKPA